MSNVSSMSWLFQDASGADESAAEEKGEAEKEVGRMGNGGTSLLAYFSRRTFNSFVLAVRSTAAACTHHAGLHAPQARR